MTVRPDHELHLIQVSEWTEEEGFDHLRKTFDNACRDFPDVMERYVVQIVEMTERAEIKSFMRRALAETFSARGYSPAQPMNVDTSNATPEENAA